MEHGPDDPIDWEPVPARAGEWDEPEPSAVGDTSPAGKGPEHDEETSPSLDPGRAEPTGTGGRDEPTGLGDEFVAELDKLEASLADVETALRRLDDGSYGRCEVCDAPLTPERLEADPVCRFCEDHLPTPAP